MFCCKEFFSFRNQKLCGVKSSECEGCGTSLMLMPTLPAKRLGTAQWGGAVSW